MDPVLLSRWQFGLTTVYHFFFVPLTLGLGWFVAFMQTRFYQTRDIAYRKMTKFWGKLFLINFAIGVVTGIVQEFQFGMNWSEYSRFVGDVFGAPLAIEALMAFFLESTFLGVWIFGEGRIPDRLHLASIWLVAVGSNLSALWILLANGWMQHPVGYVIDPATGRPILNDFLALITNEKGWIFFWHTIAAGFATASFFILGVSAYHLARRQEVSLFRPSFRMAAVVGLIAGVLVFLGGHTQGQFIHRTQPMKMAAIEALWESEQPASFSILTIGDLTGKREVWSLRLPAVTSFLACNNFECEVPGVEAVQAEYAAKYGPRDYVPLMVFTYWGFRLMMTAGVLMIALGAYFTWALPRGIETAGWLRWTPWVIILPYIGNASGWIVTEMGRQPWLVQGLLTVDDGISPNLSGTDVLISLFVFATLYAALAGINIYLMTRYAAGGPEAVLQSSAHPSAPRIGTQN